MENKLFEATKRDILINTIFILIEKAFDETHSKWLYWHKLNSFVKNETPKFGAKISPEIVLMKSINCQTSFCIQNLSTDSSGKKVFVPKCKCVVVSMISRQVIFLHYRIAFFLQWIEIILKLLSRNNQGSSFTNFLNYFWSLSKRGLKEKGDKSSHLYHHGPRGLRFLCSLNNLENQCSFFYGKWDQISFYISKYFGSTNYAKA